MAYRSIKRLYRLPAQNSSGSVRNSHAYANRRALAPLLAQAEIRIQRSLDIERVERRLNEKYVNPRRIQRLHLRSVRRNKLVEIDGARRTLITNWGAMLDDPLTLERYWLGQAAAGTLVSPEERIAQVTAVDRARIVAAAQATALDTVYFMKGAGE